MKVLIVHGNAAGEIQDLEDPAAQSLLDSGYAVPAPVEPEPVPEPVAPPDDPPKSHHTHMTSRKSGAHDP